MVIWVSHPSSPPTESNRGQESLNTTLFYLYNEAMELLTLQSPVASKMLKFSDSTLYIKRLNDSPVNVGVSEDQMSYIK